MNASSSFRLAKRLTRSLQLPKAFWISTLIAFLGSAFGANAALTLNGAFSYDGLSVGVEYNLALDPATATNVSNYAVTGAAVTNATLLSGNQSVALWLDTQINGNFIVTVSNVKDVTLANTIAPGSTRTNTVLNLQQAVFGDAAFQIASASYAGNFATVEGSGSDIWVTGDNFVYQYFTVTNDFDYALRVYALPQPAPDAFAKGGLMVRDSVVDNTSHEMLVGRTAGPDNGNVNSLQVIVRMTAGDPGTTQSQPPNPLPSGNSSPDNTWVRLTRAGNVFTAYSSTNGGAVWTQLFQFDGSLSGDGTFTNSELFLGIALCAHSAGSTTTITNVFQDLGAPPHIPVTIVAQPPASALWRQNSSQSLTVGATGFPLFYQWRTNNSGGTPIDIPGATNATFSVAAVQPFNAGTYTARVYNELNSVTSSPTVVTYTSDTNAPVLVGAFSYDGLTVGVEYNELVDPASATNVANYGINVGTISSIKLLSDGRSVSLTMNSAISGQYIVTINNVRDLALNTIAANSKATNTVLSLQTLVVFGDAANVSSSVTYTGNIATVTGGGSDIFGASDNFVYAYLTVTNDFDYMLRVQSVLNVGNAFGRAGLMVRDDIINNNGHEAMAAVNAGNTFQMLFRSQIGGGTAAVGPNTAFGSNSWVRLQRYGNVFAAFQSSNNVNWVQIGSFNATASGDNSFTNSVLYLGIAVSSHNVNTPTTAVVSDMSVIPGSPVLITSQPPVNVTWTQNEPGTISVGAIGSLLHYQWKSNGVDIAGAVFATYTNSFVQLGDGGTYAVNVYNAISVGGTVSSVMSSSSTVTVAPDTKPPRLTGVYSYDGLSVGVEFTEFIDALTATNPVNYSIGSTTVTNVTLGADGKSVVLWLSSQITGPFGVAVSGVNDSVGNPIIAGSSAGNAVGNLQLAIIGDASSQPASASYAGHTATIIGGGSDIFGTADGFVYAVLPTPVTGDFDYRMRVLSIVNNNVVDQFTRMGIMARVSTNDPGSSHFGMYVDNGNNNGVMTFQSLFRRSSAAGQNGTISNGGAGQNANGSNSWVRLRRTGASFNAYYGPDGLNWTLLRNMATNATSGAFSNTLYLGIAVNAHNAGTTATGVISDFGPTPIPPPTLAVTRSGNNLLLGWPGILPGFVVQGTPGLNPPATWTTAVAAPPIVNGNFQVAIPTTNSARFFRLKQ
jgi:hypothetical protein